MPSLLATASAVVVVAGQHHDLDAFGLQSWIASGVVALIGSATPISPAALPVDRHEHHRLALRAAVRFARDNVRGADVKCLEAICALPSATARPSTLP